MRNPSKKTIKRIIRNEIKNADSYLGRELDFKALYERNRRIRLVNYRLMAMSKGKLNILHSIENGLHKRRFFYAMAYLKLSINNGADNRKS